MPFQFDHAQQCPTCPFGLCIEDRRANPVPGRRTQFRLRQAIALNCTFEDFLPGSPRDDDPTRPFADYLRQFNANALAAGAHLFGDEFVISGSALAKVEGDVFELIAGAALWNGMAVWNRYMDTGEWQSNHLTVPNGAVPTPRRKVATLKLPRGYDSTKLFRTEVRATILAHEASLRLRSMELGLSSPDIVGVRVPDPVPPAFEQFLEPLTRFDAQTLRRLEHAYQDIEGTLDESSFLLAIAVKRSTRSDRLYQPLFEANVLKYLISHVLRGAALRFHVHLGSLEGADVAGAYRAASLFSLLRGGEPALAVDKLAQILRPIDAAQAVLDDLPLFPL